MKARSNPALGSSASARPQALWQGVWRLADPKITLASAASMFLGLAAAAHDGPLAWGWLGLTVLGIFCLEAAKNASGEVVDWDSGADMAVAESDRSPFSGGKRVLVDGLMTRRQTIMTAAVFYALGGVAGLAIVALREPSVLWLGLAGVSVAYFYHAPPLKLSYRGLGELAVALTYGPLICCGTYLVQRHAISTAVLLSSIPLGLAIGAFLWINEFPDFAADASAGKATWVVRLGRRRASRVFAVIVGTAWALLALSPLLGLPPTIWLGFAGLPLGARAVRRLLSAPERTEQIIPAQAATLFSFVLMAVGAGIGWLIG